MTWVVGACNVLGGYAVIVSDVQVTFDDGSTANLVRKAYPVGPSIIAGFAGSVLIGFKLLASLTDYLRLPSDAPPNAAWEPNIVAEHWAPIAKRVFDEAPAAARDCGSQFLLAGPHPTEDGIPGRAIPYLCKFSWPEFIPTIARNGNSHLSIGSGASVHKYVDGIMEALDPRSGLLQAEMAGRGHWGRTLGFTVNRLATWHPEMGISDHVHIHVAYRDGFVIQNSDMTEYPKDGPPREIKMPIVAESFSQLMTITGSMGVNPETAVC